ncbi:LLM class flavin-dependent oxidoreductase [Rhodococcus artemisiae]|uniref:LLM class flavin-dependent oxidoreductase n=1 Tax=Rhodococcus artemisiae TaxID=714159 RepID=A0ABU7LHQ0_9NOCA|nr:LLM class flavin-dependent oxidoreductase [Rhodococcus artemisiae]MEE2060779.1 LLM class flavin-dependent oxidoreductase [Rhodococcus artemisiae]
MSLSFHWFLPTSGDSRSIVGGGHGADLRANAGDRPATLDYLGQVARTAEQLGFEAALTPTGLQCVDAWVTTAMLVPQTRRLKFLVAFRPDALSPTLAAQMATTYQEHSDGRLLINIVTGGESSEQRAYGDFQPKDERYRRTDEFLSVVRGLWRGDLVSLEGKHVHVEGARLDKTPPVTPTVYFGGSSPAALPVAGRHADVYLTWGEPPAQVAEKIARVRAAAAEFGRTLRFGVRLHTISRDTSEQAWAEAQRLLDDMNPDDIALAQAGLAASESEGQRRMSELHGSARRHDGGARTLEIHPGLWSGVGLVRGGAGTSLVGSHAEVASLIEEYRAAGVDEFVLSGVPHLEEAYWFGEGVLPILERRGLWTHPDRVDADPKPAFVH